MLMPATHFSSQIFPTLTSISISKNIWNVLLQQIQNERMFFNMFFKTACLKHLQNL